MERRDKPRTFANHKTVARIPATSVDVTVIDLSLSGCRGRGVNARLQRGTTVLLTLSEDDEIAGQIMWQDGEEFGIKFHEQLSPLQGARFIENGSGHGHEEALFQDRFGRRLPRLKGQLRLTPC